MTFENFKKILDLQAQSFQKSQKLYELGVDTIEFNSDLESAVSGLWSEILTEKGDDLLSWFLFEKDYISGELREDMKAWDENDNEICGTLEELYQYLMDNKMFKYDSSKM